MNVNAPPRARMKLRSGLRFVPQRGDQAWYCIVEDIRHQRYFRLGRREYLIASALDGQRDLDQIFQLVAATNPELNLSPEDRDAIIRWLLSSGLVELVSAEGSGASSQTSDRSVSNSRNFDPFMMRFPLLSGERLERWLRPWLVLLSPWGMIFGGLLILGGFIGFLADPQDILTSSSKLFVPSATLWWLASWLILKTVHEFGHALLCLRFGGELRGAGLGIFYLAPIPYVDTTDMWRLPNRSARAFCAAGGMLFEMSVAAMAILVYCWVDNPIVDYACLSIAVLGTITTLAFNANPLTRFDGYFILSDLINQPNLWTESQNALKQFITRPQAALTHSLAMPGNLPFAIYGLLCTVNRIIILLTLAWGTWVTYRGIGLGMIGLAAYLWFLAPWLKKRSMLKAQSSVVTPSPKVGQTTRPSDRWIKLSTMAAAGVAVILAALMIPSPFQPVSPGFVAYAEPIILRAPVDCIVREVFGRDGQVVESNQPLVRLENLSLDLEQKRLALAVAIAEERCQVLRAQNKIAESQAEQAELAAIREQKAQVDAKVQKLLVTAPQQGKLIARPLNHQIGQFLKAGQPIASLASNENLEVTCSIAQHDVDRYRRCLGRKFDIFSDGLPRIEGKLLDVSLRGSEVLENSTLAARYGGPIGVQLSAPQNEQEPPIKAFTPRFEARLAVDAASLKHFRLGQHCRVRPSEDRMTIASVAYRTSAAFWTWLFPETVDKS